MTCYDKQDNLLHIDVAPQKSYDLIIERTWNYFYLILALRILNILMLLLQFRQGASKLMGKICFVSKCPFRSESLHQFPLTKECSTLIKQDSFDTGEFNYYCSQT